MGLLRADGGAVSRTSKKLHSNMFEPINSSVEHTESELIISKAQIKISPKNIVFIQPTVGRINIVLELKRGHISQCLRDRQMSESVVVIFLTSARHRHENGRVPAFS